MVVDHRHARWWVPGQGPGKPHPQWRRGVAGGVTPRAPHEEYAPVVGRGEFAHRGDTTLLDGLPAPGTGHLDEPPPPGQGSGPREGLRSCAFAASHQRGGPATLATGPVRG